MVQSSTRRKRGCTVTEGKNEFSFNVRNQTGCVRKIRRDERTKE